MRIHNTEPNSVMCKTTYCWQGLASTEDFTSVQLRRGQAVPHQNLLPYREKMLLQVNLRWLLDGLRPFECVHNTFSGEQFFFAWSTVRKGKKKVTGLRRQKHNRHNRKSNCIFNVGKLLWYFAVLPRNLPSNGIIILPTFLRKANFFSKKPEVNPMFYIFSDLSTFMA
jgi:hypothetical protein